MIVGRFVGWTVCAVAVFALAPPVHPLLDAAFPTSTCLGVAAGALLFAALARRAVPLAALGRLSRRRLGARVVVLTVKSFQEEAVWRALVLGVLAGSIGRAGALAASTAMFAASHAPAQGRHAVVHLGTGCVFGLAYLGAGFEAAVAAHAAYNVLVGTGLAAIREMSLSATSAAD